MLRVVECNWYAWLRDALASKGHRVCMQVQGAFGCFLAPADCDCFMQDMPDPYVAKESVWLPFVRSTVR